MVFDREKLNYYDPTTFAANAKAAMDAVANRPSDPHNVYVPPNPGANFYFQPQVPGRNPFVYTPPSKTPPAPTNPAEASRNGRARRGG